MEQWNRRWGKSPLARVPVEKTIIGVVAAVSVGIFAYSRVLKRAAASGGELSGRAFDGSMAGASQPHPLGAAADSIMVVPPAGTSAPAQTPAGRAAAGAPAAPPPASAQAPSPGWTAPQAPNGAAPRLSPVAARPDPVGNLGAGTSASMRGGEPVDPQTLVARAIASAARGLPGVSSPRSGRSLRGFAGGGLGAAAGGLGGAAGRTGPEVAAAGSAAQAPGTAPAPAGGGAAPGAPPASAKDASPGGNPSQGSTTSGAPGGGAGTSGGTGITKQDVQYHRDDLRLRSRCLRIEEARPAVGIAESALKRRRDAAKGAAADLRVLAATLRQPPGVGPELTLSAASVATPLDTDDSGQASPETEVADAHDRLGKSVSCLAKLRQEADLPHDAAAADRCHALGLEGLEELKDAAARLTSLRQSGAAQLDALHSGAVMRQGASFKDRMEAEAVQRLQASYTRTMSRALDEADGKSDPAPAKDLASTRKAAKSFGQADEQARQTVRDNRAWTEKLVNDGDRTQAQGKLDDSDAALTDAMKLWTDVAGSAAAAGDAARLTQASRDGVDALGDLQGADASLDNIQRRAYDGRPAGAPPSQMCASLRDTYNK